MNERILITGATGLVGKALVRHLSDKMDVIACVRDYEKAVKLFNSNIEIFTADITQKINYPKNIDYIIHCASNTSSKSFVENPVETLQTIILGTDNVLRLGTDKKVKSVVYLSSMEVYGKIENNIKLKESELGTLDLCNPRNSYPIGKRAAECLCCSYHKEKNLPVKIARLAQIIGGDVNSNDTRVFTQFAKSIIEKRDIILNTEAKGIKSFCYIDDAAEGLLTILLKGENGEIYNVSAANASIRDAAEILTKKYPPSKLKIELKNSGIYPPETNWNLDSSKLTALNWKPETNLEVLLEKLIISLKDK